MGLTSSKCKKVLNTTRYRYISHISDFEVSDMQYTGQYQSNIAGIPKLPTQ